MDLSFMVTAYVEIFHKTNWKAIGELPFQTETITITIQFTPIQFRIRKSAKIPKEIPLSHWMILSWNVRNFRMFKRRQES